MMKRFFLAVMLTVLFAIPACAMADCQCVQPNIGQSGYSAPTCTQPGYDYLECVDCGAQWKEQAASPLGHDWSQCGYKPATCSKEGAIEYQCTRCLAEKSEPIPKTAHNYAYSMTNPAFCETEGKIWYECTGCGDTKYDTIPATGHDDVIHSTTGNRCTTGVTRVWKCRDCGRLETEKLPATGHEWKSDGVNEPTCVKAGYEDFVCTQCGETKRETLNPTGKHVYTTVISKTDPTCTSNGRRVLQCEYCSAEKSEFLRAKGHDWEAVSALGATCDAGMIVTYQCKLCGETKTEEEGEPAGHQWTDDLVIRKATCTEDGLASSMCALCGKTDKERTIPKLGHSWGDTRVITAATCTKAGRGEAVCKTCGEKKTVEIRSTGHEWGEWKITVKATESRDGARERVCKACGGKETETYKAAASDTDARPETTGSSYQKQSDTEGLTVFTTAGKVNLRSGPGKSNSRLLVAEKRNTELGELLDAQVDKDGTVWYQVRYKNKKCWVMADFAEVIVGEIDVTETREPDRDGNELTGYYLRSFEFAAEDLELEANPEAEIAEYSSDAVRVSGWYYVEEMELTGKGYTLYGIEVGDGDKDVQKMLKKANLLVQEDGSGEYVCRVPVSPYSLTVDEDGFDGVLIITMDEDGCVASILIRSGEAEEE